MSNHFIIDDLSLGDCTSHSIENIPKLDGELRLLHVNARDIRARDKISIIQRLALKKELQANIICVSETWLKDYESNSYNISGYSHFSICRSLMNAGGVSIYVHAKLSVLDVKTFASDDQEVQAVRVCLSLNHKKVFILSVYSNSVDKVNDLVAVLDRALVDTDKNTVILAGDLNVNILTDSNALNILSSFLCPSGFIPCITAVTRPSSGTCLDHYWISNHDLSSKVECGIIETSEISDHFPIYMNIGPNSTSESYNTYRRRIFSSRNYNIFETKLREQMWQLVFQEESPDDALRVFRESLFNLYDHSFPIKSKPPPSRPSHDAWWNDQLETMRKRCDYLSRQYHKTKLPSDKKNFYQFRSTYRFQLKETKRKFYHDKVEKLRNVPGGIFKITRQVCGNTKSPKPPIRLLKVADNEIIGEREIADTFADNFSFVPQITDSLSDPTMFLQEMPLQTRFSLMYINPATLVKEARNMNTNMKGALNNVPSKVLKSVMFLIAVPLAYIFNRSIKHSVFPEFLKKLQVIPLYKGKGDRTDPNNYRPIALTDFIAKLFERCIKNQFVNFLESFSVLANTQYGFRARRSTELALSDMTEFIRRGADGGGAVVGVFLDAAKAFNSLRHDIFLKILVHLGVDESTCRWFESYLSGRHIQVKINHTVSKQSATPAGIPQGTVLGPLCFIVYINLALSAISDTSTKHRVISYADDTSVLFHVSKEATVFDIQRVNLGLRTMSSAFSSLQLGLNVTKTKLVVFKSSHSRIDILDGDIKLNEVPLKVEAAAVVLGVHLQGDLKWSELANQVVSKCRIATACLSRLRNSGLPVTVLVHAYKAFVEPILSYCISVWGGTYNNIIRRIQICQNYALRAALGLHWFSSVRRARIFHSILSVEALFRFRIVTNVYKWGTGKICVSDFFDWTFNDNLERELRTNRSLDLITSRNRTVFVQQGPCCSAVTAWNSLPIEIRQSDGLQMFRRLVKKHLL